MGWRFWTSDKSEAQASLETLQQNMNTDFGTTTESGTTGDSDTTADSGEDEIFVTLLETPAARAPGSPLWCLNEGAPIHVGDRVQLSTSFRIQETRIVSIVRDGVPCATLELDERGHVALDDTADLSDVYRTSCLMDAGTPVTREDSGFLVQVHTAEQRGEDVYVVGKARGRVTKGAQTVVSPWTNPEKRFAKVKSVDVLPDGRVGVLLAKREASTFEYGDEIVSW